MAFTTQSPVVELQQDLFLIPVNGLTPNTAESGVLNQQTALIQPKSDIHELFSFDLDQIDDGVFTVAVSIEVPINTRPEIYLFVMPKDQWDNNESFNSQTALNITGSYKAPTTVETRNVYHTIKLSCLIKDNALYLNSASAGFDGINEFIPFPAEIDLTSTRNWMMGGRTLLSPLQSVEVTRTTTGML